MKFTWIQKSYEVRDASEIALGVLVLCQGATYAMLRYRSRRTDLLVWGLSAGFVVWEDAR